MRCDVAASLRIKRLLLGGAALLGLGLLYALANVRLGFYVPCLFRRVTGWKCPGCGVTSLCLALLRLDLPAAWAANPVLLLLSPFIAFLAARMAVRYVRGGSPAPRPWEGRLAWGLVAVLVLWGAARNVLGL